MSKTLLLLALIAIAVVGIGTAISPNSPAFWLASSAHNLQYVRVILSAVLLVQLSTHPPRHLWFRLIAGTLAAAVGIWAVQQTYAYHMQFLDTLAFISASLAVFVTALERNVPALSPKTLPSNKKILA